MKLKIQVTEQDTRRENSGLCNDCMCARAIKRRLKKKYRPLLIVRTKSATIDTINLISMERPFNFPLPPKATEKIHQWCKDDAPVVQPFSFVIDIPAKFVLRKPRKAVTA